ncbi:MAG: hypothetical protein AAF652_06180 [Cyanobacteria bacterium P01_C01_bin.72]
MTSTSKEIALNKFWGFSSPMGGKSTWIDEPTFYLLLFPFFLLVKSTQKFSLIGVGDR